MSGEPPAGGSITGTLKWLADGDIADYWGAGNFVALRFAPLDEGAVVKVGLDPSQGSGLVPLDEDLNGVFKVTDKDTQVFVVETTKDGETLRQVFDLSGLVLEPEPRPALEADPATVTVSELTSDPLFELSVNGEPWTPDVAPVVKFNGQPATPSPDSPEGGWLFYNAAENFALLFGVDFYGQPSPPGMVFAEWGEDPQTVEIEIGDAAGLYTPATVTVTVAGPPELVATPSTLDLAVGNTGDVVLSLSDGSPLDFTQIAWNTMPTASVASVTGGDSVTGTVTFTAAGAGSTTAVLSYPNGPDTRSTAIIEINVSAPTVTVDPSGR